MQGAYSNVSSSKVGICKSQELCQSDRLERIFYRRVCKLHIAQYILYMGSDHLMFLNR